MLISHLHRDHLDLPSLAQLDPRAELIVPPGGARVLRSEQAHGHASSPRASGGWLGYVEVTAVPADHDGRRLPLSSDGEAVGYVLRGRQRIYFAGDTEPFAEMAELAPLDVALLPDLGLGPVARPGPHGPRRGRRGGRAAAAHGRRPDPLGHLPARRHGRRRAHALRDPPLRFADRVAERAPATRVEVLAPGGELALPVKG